MDKEILITKSGIRDHYTVQRDGGNCIYVADKSVSYAPPILTKDEVHNWVCNNATLSLK